VGGSNNAESLDTRIAYTKRAALEFLSHNSAWERPWDSKLKPLDSWKKVALQGKGR
jgi:hypothetical protein